MKHNTEFVNVDKSDALEERISAALNKIGAKYSWVTSAEVFIKLENDKTGKGKVCEMKLSLPGPQIFASSNSFSFETAVHDAQKELERQLKRIKEEKYSHH